MLDIRNGLNMAEFHDVPLSQQQAQGWIAQAEELTDQAALLASGNSSSFLTVGAVNGNGQS